MINPRLKNPIISILPPSMESKLEKEKELLKESKLRITYQFRNSSSKDPWSGCSKLKNPFSSLLPWLLLSLTKKMRVYLSLSFFARFCSKKMRVIPFCFLLINSNNQRNGNQQLGGLKLPHVTLLTSLTCTHIPLSSCHVAQPQCATCPEVRKLRFSKI